MIIIHNHIERTTSRRIPPSRKLIKVRIPTMGPIKPLHVHRSEEFQTESNTLLYSFILSQIPGYSSLLRHHRLAINVSIVCRCASGDCALICSSFDVIPAIVFYRAWRWMCYVWVSGKVSGRVERNVVEEQKWRWGKAIFIHILIPSGSNSMDSRGTFN